MGDSVQYEKIGKALMKLSNTKEQSAKPPNSGLSIPTKIKQTTSLVTSKQSSTKGTPSHIQNHPAFRYFTQPHQVYVSGEYNPHELTVDTFNV